MRTENLGIIQRIKPYGLTLWMTPIGTVLPRERGGGGGREVRESTKQVLKVNSISRAIVV